MAIHHNPLLPPEAMVNSGSPQELKKVVIYTDGSCDPNPGCGGYGAILRLGPDKKISEGYRKTTNNRMELMAVVKALQTLTEPCRITLYSDSQYVVNSISKGWARKWRDNGWMRNKKDHAENPDLWESILQLCDTHEVEFRWVKAHSSDSGNVHAKYNNMCDQLAKSAAKRPTSDLLVDEGYEARQQTDC